MPTQKKGKVTNNQIQLEIKGLSKCLNNFKTKIEARLSTTEEIFLSIGTLLQESINSTDLLNKKFILYNERVDQKIGHMTTQISQLDLCRFIGAMEKMKDVNALQEVTAKIDIQFEAIQRERQILLDTIFELKNIKKTRSR